MGAFGAVERCDAPDDCGAGQRCCAGFAGASCSNACMDGDLLLCNENNDCGPGGLCLRCTLTDGQSTRGICSFDGNPPMQGVVGCDLPEEPPVGGEEPPVGGEEPPVGGEEPPGDYSDFEGNVLCGGGECSLEGNICCTGLGGQTCEPGAMCPALNAPQLCDGPEDCAAGDTCCVGFPSGAACRDACGGNEQTLCHFDQDCPAGQICKTCQYPGGTPVVICGAPGAVVQGAESCDQ